MSYCFHKAKTSSVRLWGAAMSSFFHHLYVSRCPLWQIAIPHHIRSNLELPHCFAFFWAELMLNKGRLAEHGRGSVIPTGRENHRDPLNTLWPKRRGLWSVQHKTFVERCVKWLHYHQLGIISVITSQTAERNVVIKAFLKLNIYFDSSPLSVPCPLLILLNPSVGGPLHMSLDLLKVSSSSSA